MTSPNGITWTNRTSGTTKNLLNVTYGNNIFVAVGEGDTLLTSPDGISWTNRAVPDSLYTDVTYGNNTFVVVGSRILTSPDGVTWTESPRNGTNAIHVTYGNNVFVACAYYGEIFSSPDGIAWTNRVSGTSPPGYRRDFFDVTFGDNTFVAVGLQTQTSSDGITWTFRSAQDVEVPFSVTYGNNTFVAVGIGTILTSTDGITWISRTSVTRNTLRGVTYGNNTFIAVGDGGTILQSGPTVAVAPILTAFPASDQVVQGLPYTFKGTIQSGTPITEVTLDVLNYDGGDLWAQTFTTPVNTFDLSSVTIDTSSVPLSTPGSYTVRVWAKTTDTNYTPLEPLGEMVLKVVKGGSQVGDINGDGQTNILDLFWMELQKGPVTDDNRKADVNGDNQVNILDLLLAAQHLGE